jgi:hypothetical protein
MYKPARKISNRGTKKNTGLFPSLKNERSVAFESLIERDYIYLLEFDSNVIRYQEQPVTISFKFSNRTHNYTPDFLVQRKNKIQLIEIKPKSKLEKLLSNELTIKKYEAATLYCKSNNFDEFKIVTDEEIRSGCILENIKTLFHYSRSHVPAADKIKIRNELMLNGPQKISDLLLKICDSIGCHSKYHSYILSLLYHKEISTDLQSPINKISIIDIESRGE